ncbi:MAG: hypothetical protein IJ300_04585 [Clostridia bacterium]|nr:hypothetical protein [Clostridia bacterium]
MAFELALTKDRAYELLELTVTNGARPVIVIEDPDGTADEMIIDLIFSGRKDSAIFEYNDFVMNQAFDISKINRLGDYCFVIIKGVKSLYGKSATAKILADFVKQMAKESTSVIFTGQRAAYDMSEFIELASDCIHYIITIDSEKE